MQSKYPSNALEIYRCTNIKSVKHFDEKECSALALAFGGLKYYQQVYLKNKEDRVKLNYN